MASGANESRRLDLASRANASRLNMASGANESRRLEWPAETMHLDSTWPVEPMSLDDSTWPAEPMHLNAWTWPLVDNSTWSVEPMCLLN